MKEQKVVGVMVETIEQTGDKFLKYLTIDEEKTNENFYVVTPDYTVITESVSTYIEWYDLIHRNHTDKDIEYLYEKTKNDIQIIYKKEEH